MIASIFLHTHRYCFRRGLTFLEVEEVESLFFANLGGNLSRNFVIEESRTKLKSRARVWSESWVFSPRLDKDKRG